MGDSFESLCNSRPVLPAKPRRRRRGGTAGAAVVAVGSYPSHCHVTLLMLFLLLVRRRLLPRRAAVHMLPHHHHHAAGAGAAVRAVGIGDVPRHVALLLLRGGGTAAGGRGGALALYLAELVEVVLERIDVVLEAERGHGPEQVVAVDGLALLALALVGGLPGDEGDELGHALLHRLLGVLADLGVRRQRLLHDPAHVRDRQEPVLLTRRRQLTAGVARAAGVVVRVGHIHRPRTRLAPLSLSLCV
jgi:hypothetical protein